MVEKKQSSVHIVIMAGGCGSRLWPKSTKEHPKQFQNLVSETRSLLQQTFDRVRLLADVTHIFVSTVAQYVKIVRMQLPELLKDNIIIEPYRRDTAPALAYVAQNIVRRNPEAIIMTTPSDHAMKENCEFVSAVQTACSVVNNNPERIGLIGIKAMGPSTSLGYIQQGSEMRDGYSRSVFAVASFKEKPSKEKADAYYRDWAYLWNAAYFIFRADTLLDFVEQHAPHIMTVLRHMDEITDLQDRLLLFSSLPAEPIDTVILEKLSPEQCFVVPAKIDWSDVGNWRTLHGYLRSQSGQDNITRGAVVPIDTGNCYISAHEKKIVTFGVRDLIIVEADDVLFVADRDVVSDMKMLMSYVQDDDIL